MTVYVSQIPSRLEGSVWIPTVEISAAKEFGPVRVLVPSGLNYTEMPTSLTDALRPLLKFEPQRDQLLPMGDPLVMAACAAVLGRHGSFSILKWDRHARKYFSYTVRVPS